MHAGCAGWSSELNLNPNFQLLGAVQSRSPMKKEAQRGKASWGTTSLRQVCYRGLAEVGDEATFGKIRILLLEELLWKQKSRNDRLIAGDNNTKFFHTSTIVRRRRTKIESLMNDEGVWVDDRWN